MWIRELLGDIMEAVFNKSTSFMNEDGGKIIDKYIDKSQELGLRNEYQKLVEGRNALNNTLNDQRLYDSADDLIDKVKGRR